MAVAAEPSAEPEPPLEVEHKVSDWVALYAPSLARSSVPMFAIWQRTS